jgi:hypothetical protein
MKIQGTNISHFFNFYLMSPLPIFIDENTSLALFPYFFNFNLKSALPIFINENTSVASFPYFFNFNLKSALPIFIDENTKIIFRNKLASFPIFSTLTLGRLYLFSSMKIPRTHMELLHFWFFVLLGIKSLLTYLITLNSLFYVYGIEICVPTLINLRNFLNNK